MWTVRASESLTLHSVLSVKAHATILWTRSTKRRLVSTMLDIFLVMKLWKPFPAAKKLGHSSWTPIKRVLDQLRSTSPVLPILAHRQICGAIYSQRLSQIIRDISGRGTLYCSVPRCAVPTTVNRKGGRGQTTSVSIPIRRNRRLSDGKLCKVNLTKRMLQIFSFW